MALSDIYFLNHFSRVINTGRQGWNKEVYNLSDPNAWEAGAGKREERCSSRLESATHTNQLCVNVLFLIQVYK